MHRYAMLTNTIYKAIMAFDAQLRHQVPWLHCLIDWVPKTATTKAEGWCYKLQISSSNKKC